MQNFIGFLVLFMLAYVFSMPYAIRITDEIWNWTNDEDGKKVAKILILWVIPFLAPLYFGVKMGVPLSSSKPSKNGIGGHDSGVSGGRGDCDSGGGDC